MTTPIDYAPRDERSWVRRHRRMLAIIVVTIAVAAAAYPTRHRVGAWLRWQRDWRAVAALPVVVDPTIEQALSVDVQQRVFPTVLPATPRLMAFRTLRASDGGFLYFTPDGWRGDIYVFPMRRPDGTRRIVAMDRPHFVNRPLDGVDVAILREPSWSARSASVAYQNAGMTSNGMSGGEACEIRFDPATPTRLVMRIGYQPTAARPVESMTFVGTLTDEDRLRWRLTSCTHAERGPIYVTPGEVFEFEDAAGRLMTNVRETTVDALLQP